MIIAFLWINEIALFLSAFVYTTTQERKFDFNKRVFLSAAVFCVLSFNMNALLISNIIETSIFIRAVWYGILVLMMKFCWEIKWSYALYFSIWSFVIWQLLYEFWYMLLNFAGISATERFWFVAVGNILVFAIGYTVAAVTFGKWMSADIENIGPRQLSSALLVFWIFEIIGMSQRHLDITASDSKWELLLLTQILIVVVLYLQNELFKKSALKQELSLMNLLHKKEHEQYQLSKENIELINRKCHDLKHQIRAIRTMAKEDIDSYLDEIENSLRIYEAIAKTGNEVLDTILTEKSLYCKNHGINISCVADGRQMEFINTVDLYSLLGNALDNAIEAVEKFKEQEKRIIDVLIYRQQQFLVVNITNPAPQALVFEEEIPITTKGDRDYHGFGIKSMKYIVKKYNGFLNIKEEDGCFCLEVLFPIPATT